MAKKDNCLLSITVNKVQITQKPLTNQSAFTNLLEHERNLYADLFHHYVNFQILWLSFEMSNGKYDRTFSY